MIRPPRETDRALEPEVVAPGPPDDETVLRAWQRLQPPDVVTILGPAPRETDRAPVHHAGGSLTNQDPLSPSVPLSPAASAEPIRDRKREAIRSAMERAGRPMTAREIDEAIAPEVGLTQGGIFQRLRRTDWVRYPRDTGGKPIRSLPQLWEIAR